MTQLDEWIRDAILGNVQPEIAFRLGVAIAEILERGFALEVRARDIVGLPDHLICLKLMTDGVVSRPFRAELIAPR